MVIRGVIFFWIRSVRSLGKVWFGGGGGWRDGGGVGCDGDGDGMGGWLGSVVNFDVPFGAELIEVRGWVGGDDDDGGGEKEFEGIEDEDEDEDVEIR